LFEARDIPRALRYRRGLQHLGGNGVHASRGFMSLISAVVLCTTLLCGPSPAKADVVSDRLCVSSKALIASPRGQAGRASVLMSLAMFNSLNAITPRYAFYGAAIESVPDASPDAAAAMAAFTILASVANADHAARTSDSLARVEPAKRELAAGVYELTADHKTESNVALSKMRPCAITNAFAYDPGPPPAVESEVAKRDLA
jgi:hypothetical protein